MYVWDCPHCEDHVERSSDESEVKERGREHYINHLSELAAEFKRDYQGMACNGGCSYLFPYESEDADHPGLRCPNCGHDHTKWHAGRRVYWNIETE
jgi:DNA-directed RNA polymerase subunit RPC12/RpoP